MYVYKITNLINNKIYIGITVKNIELRYNEHLKCSKSYPLYNAFNKYGRENFRITVLEKCDTREEACSLEKYYIKKYDSTNPNYGYNQTTGGEDNCGSANPRATLTDEDVLTIRKTRFNTNQRCKTVYKSYKDKISFSAFEKIWEGITWKHLGAEYLDVLKNPEHKANKGETNGNAVYTDKEVLIIRNYYVSHTLTETYNKFGKRSASKDSFRSVLKTSYKHLPIYDKKNKCWLLNEHKINIQEYTNPVSTILGSEE